MKYIDNVITDNDGVNINSEDRAMAIMAEYGAEFIRRYKPDAVAPPDFDANAFKSTPSFNGDNLKEFIYRTYPGTSTDRIVEILIDRFELPRDLIARDLRLDQSTDVSTHIADLITIETNNNFKSNLKSVPGTTQAWSEVRDLVGPNNMALATTSRGDRMDVSLKYATDPATSQSARLEEFFPEGDLRRSGYGHPNKYDEAFRALGWDPKRTIVVEDSRSGVTKAMHRRPNTSVIGTVAADFYEDKPAQAKALMDDGARLVISDMADLPKAVKWIGEYNMDPKMKPDFVAQVFTPPASDRIARPVLSYDKR